MIPYLPSDPKVTSLYATSCAELRARGFAGDLTTGEADRTVLAADNSIYQVTPRAIAFPRALDDLVRIATLLAEERFAEVRIAPRGGGTGPSGRLLADGYSRRSQVKHIGGLRLPHPVEILRGRLAASPLPGRRASRISA